MEFEQLSEWFQKYRIADVACLVPDLTGIARGKSMTPALFLSSMKNDQLRIPEGIYTTNVQGAMVYNEHIVNTEKDLVLKPDLSTLHLVDWNADTTACFICDTETSEGKRYDLAPRQILQNVVDLFAKKGWKPVVGPEIEFYLIAKFSDVVLEPSAPDGRSGLREFGQHIYSLDAVDEFDGLFEEIYNHCEKQNIDLDTLIHEDGLCQFEVNLRHNDALKVADQLYLFKRVARQVARRHGVFVTFMAKPYADESGSSIHLHQSLVDIETGQNMFSDDAGEDTEFFMNYIGGLQKYLPQIMPLLAPYTNSYNRFEAYMSAPTNTHWSRENRTVGFRVPTSNRHSRRIENRIAGADVNPYLAIAASLICGYLGLSEKVKPRPEYFGEGYSELCDALPASLPDAVDLMAASDAIRSILGDAFVDTYTEVKRTEYLARSKVLSPWDVRYLMVNV